MKIYYRISNQGYSKIKPSYITKINCLTNFLARFQGHDITVVGDNLTDPELLKHILNIPTIKFAQTSLGNAGSFLHVLDLALQLSDNEIVYFVEDDYLHKANSPGLIEEALGMGAGFVSLYDHPDKYMNNIETTQLYMGKSTHWRIASSTTMTFAAKVSTLKSAESVIRSEIVNNQHPNDFMMFMKLRQSGYILVTPVPGYATHGETQWLTPLTDWEAEAMKTIDTVQT